MAKNMDKRLALTFILCIQPIFAFLIWFSMTKLFDWLGLVGTTRAAVVIGMTTLLYLFFCYMFARGFLSSSEAKKLGF